MEKIAKESSPPTQTGEGGRNPNRADVCSDPGRSASPPKESRGDFVSGVDSKRAGSRRDSGDGDSACRATP